MGNCAVPFVNTGAGIRDKKYLFALWHIYVAHSPTKLAFYSGGRFTQLSTSRRKENRQTANNEKRRKSASPLLSSSRTGTVKRASALSYFQPLNISFIAASNADFILFSIIWKINASTIASYFFLRFFSSSFFWLI